MKEQGKAESGCLEKGQRYGYLSYFYPSFRKGATEVVCILHDCVSLHGTKKRRVRSSFCYSSGLVHTVASNSNTKKMSSIS